MRLREIEKSVKQLLAGGGGGYSEGTTVDRSVDVQAAVTAGRGAVPDGEFLVFRPTDNTKWTRVRALFQLNPAAGTTSILNAYGNQGPPDWPVDHDLFQAGRSAPSDATNMADDIQSLTLIVPPGGVYYFMTNGGPGWDMTADHDAGTYNGPAGPYGIEGSGVWINNVYETPLL